jgi:carboxyl-terminal processing protease
MRYSLLFLFSLITSSLFSQNALDKTSKRVTKYLSELCNTIKKNALYTDSIQWDVLESKVHALSKGMNKIEECRPIIDTVLMALRQAGDKHSGFIEKQAAQQITSSDYSGKPVESSYLNDGIGYIKVPPFFSLDLSASKRFATEIQDQIRALDVNYIIQGWIVDLRGNKGGNMHPMIKGLRCLTDSGVFGYVLYPKQAVALSTEYGQTAFVRLKSTYRIKHPSNRIAILIDSSTASSGEFTAIAFKTLPNVQFFGQPSAGYTTSNQTFRLSDGSYLYLATAFMADREKNRYFPNIIPDVIIPLKQDKENNLTISIAKEWLLSK